MRGLGLSVAWISAALLWIAPAAQAGTLTLAASDAAGLRDFGDDGTVDLVLDFLAVKDGTEDRTVLHFPLAGLTPSFLSATLVVPVDNFDVGGDLGEIDVFFFGGDGVVSLDEYGAGLFLTSFVADPDGTYNVDVGAQLSALLGLGSTHMAFRFSTTSDDRWFLGDIVGLPDPTLRIVAEPAGLAALGLALAATRRRRASGR